MTKKWPRTKDDQILVLIYILHLYGSRKVASADVHSWPTGRTTGAGKTVQIIGGKRGGAE